MDEGPVLFVHRYDEAMKYSTDSCISANLITKHFVTINMYYN